MDFATITGMLGGILLIILAFVLKGNSVLALLDVSSFFIVIFGSYGAVMASTRLGRALGLVNYLKIVFRVPRFQNKIELINQLVQFSDNARKEGLLSLDDMLNEVEDDFLRSGLRLVVDGTDPDIIRKTLYTGLNQMELRHEDGIDFFRRWAKVTPAFGMIGTLLGLIAMLTNLEDTASIGPNMAIALITTLYGTIIANLILIPVQYKLQERNQEEVQIKEIMAQGILSIQSGDNPHVLEDKLFTFLPPSDRPGLGTR